MRGRDTLRFDPVTRGAQTRFADRINDRIFYNALRDQVLRFVRACAALYGEIRSAREAAGRPISAADAMIAATARAYGATFIATRNTRDFALCGVGLVDPWRAA